MFRADFLGLAEHFYQKRYTHCKNHYITNSFEHLKLQKAHRDLNSLWFSRSISTPGELLHIQADGFDQHKTVSPWFPRDSKLMDAEHCVRVGNHVLGVLVSGGKQTRSVYMLVDGDEHRKDANLLPNALQWVIRHSAHGELRGPAAAPNMVFVQSLCIRVVYICTGS